MISLKITHSIFFLAAFLCNAVGASNYRRDSIIGGHLLSSKILMMRDADSVVLLNIDRSRINRGVISLTKDQRADSALMKRIDSIWNFEKSMTYLNVPFSKKVVIVKRDSISRIAEIIHSNLGYQRIALAACQSWIGSIVMYKKGKYSRLDFESQNGSVTVYKNDKQYSVNANPKVWNDILSYISGYDLHHDCECK